jgi:hypothetical protein
MAAFATSLKRSKHNDEKRLSEFLLNEEIPRLEGIACEVFVVKFWMLSTHDSTVSKERAERRQMELELMPRKRSRFVPAFGFLHSAIINVPLQSYSGSHNKENQGGGRRGSATHRCHSACLPFRHHIPCMMSHITSGASKRGGAQTTRGKGSQEARSRGQGEGG